MAKGGYMEEEVQLLERIKRDVLFGHDIAPPSVNVDKCKGCGQCVKVCPAIVFELREKKSKVIHGERCFACGHCWAVCPEEAVIQNEVTTATSLKPGPVAAVPSDTLQLLIRERRSTRLFSDRLISREQLIQIIEAGRYAPSSGNRQDVQYIVLSNKEKVSELRLLVESFMDKTFKLMQNKAMALFLNMKLGRSAVYLMRYYAMGYQAYKESNEKNAYFALPFGPAVIITHAKSFDPMAPFSCAVALYNCSLMAHSMGLGSCFVGFVQAGANMDRKIRQWLGIPKENQSYGAMVVGYPDVKYRRLVERKHPEIKWH
jgi:nitroreductase/NAD-dependent dihydropyrimidine dehydrogenase PreA subunit